MFNGLLNFTKSLPSFGKFYFEYKAKMKRSENMHYRILTTFEQYKKNNLIQLAFTDAPGDLLAPLPIKEIKSKPDIISRMNPIDINTINDLFYLSNDKLIQFNISDNIIIALTNKGQKIKYDIDERFDPESIRSTRLSYMIGYMQAEKITRNFFQGTEKYKIIKDYLSSLEILDVKTNQCFLKNPLDILYSEQYKYFSKEDICRIGYICGQMSQT